MSQSFKQWSLKKLVPGESIPAPLYLHMEGRYIMYRKKGQVIDRLTFDRMELKKFEFFFILVTDESAFEAWAEKSTRTQAPEPMAIEKIDPATIQSLKSTREGARRQIADIFHSFHSDENVSRVLDTSTKLVDELTKLPFASQPLEELQSLSQGTADHSVNVSILSVYLAINMGYSHMVILKHLAAGALLHDIGKVDALRVDEGKQQEFEEKMKRHPLIGEDLAIKMGSVSREVQMIIAQHHEFHDGSGFPKGLHGEQIYDLAKIVSIANQFDELVANGTGPLADRQKKAIAQLEGPLAPKFNPMKLKKALKILSLGI